MQQHQFASTQHNDEALAVVQPMVKAAPVELDASVLKFIAGGTGEVAGPKGGWDCAVVEGPKGGW